MQLRKIFCFVIVYLFLTGYFISLASASTVQLRGKVLDDSGDPVTQTNVVVTDASGKRTGTITTDPFGNYTESVSPGTYSIEINPPKGSNLQPAHMTNVKVSDNTLIPPVKLNSSVKSGKSMSASVILYVIVAVVVIIFGFIFFGKKTKDKK